jgi:L-seryl-tRNA(Ser) seleniumtransferase
MDLRTGQRTRRDVRIEPQLCALAGCEAATVVNNNAAAVFLALRVLAAGREVITSRGELIEIGGSFRIPDIVRESGCTLVEVGTTNRTRLNDYERVVTPQTALILKTHSSNYRVRGFTAEVELADLAGLARKHRLLLFYDLGSGYISPSGGPALPEPDVLAAIREGADLVSFSGDKLLRGPQAGILIGRRDIVARLRRNPLWRVLRIDKLTAAALSATLVVHLRATGMALHEPGDSLSGAPLALAEQLAAAVAAAQPLWRVRTEQGTGFYGGGSLPDEEVPSALVLVEHPRLPAEELDRLARGSDIPVVGYVQRGAYVLNVLALLPGDVERIAQCLGELPRD